MNHDIDVLVPGDDTPVTAIPEQAGRDSASVDDQACAMSRLGRLQGRVIAGRPEKRKTTQLIGDGLLAIAFTFLETGRGRDHDPGRCFVRGVPVPEVTKVPSVDTASGP